MKGRRLAGAALVALVATVALASTVLAPPARGQLDEAVEDVPVVADNVPDAIDTLLAGLQEAADVLATTRRAAATSESAGDAIVEASATLVDGTEQVGALGLGVFLLNGGVQQIVGPYLDAVDDPTTAGEVVDPTDLPTLLENLPAAIDGLLRGDDFADGALVGIAEALRGNLVVGPGFDAIAAPATVGNLFNGAGVALTELLAGTSFEALVLPVGVVLLVAVIAAAGGVQQIEDALAPAFAALGPVTEPLAVAIEGL